MYDKNSNNLICHRIIIPVGLLICNSNKQAIENTGMAKYCVLAAIKYPVQAFIIHNIYILSMILEYNTME